MNIHKGKSKQKKTSNGESKTVQEVQGDRKSDPSGSKRTGRKPRVQGRHGDRHAVVSGSTNAGAGGRTVGRTDSTASTSPGAPDASGSDGLQQVRHSSTERGVGAPALGQVERIAAGGDIQSLGIDPKLLLSALSQLVAQQAQAKVPLEPNPDHEDEPSDKIIDPVIPKTIVNRSIIKFRKEDVVPPGYDRPGRQDFKNEIGSWDRALRWMSENKTNRLFLLTMPNVDKRPYMLKGVKLGPIYMGHNLRPDKIPDGRIVMGTITSERALASLPKDMKPIIVSSPAFKKGEVDDDKLEKLKGVRKAYGRFYDSRLTLGSVLLPCGALNDIIVEASGAEFKGEVKAENEELDLLDEIPESSLAASSVEKDSDKRKEDSHSNQAGLENTNGVETETEGAASTSGGEED
jgi:hypothetical protein